MYKFLAFPVGLLAAGDFSRDVQLQSDPSKVICTFTGAGCVATASAIECVATSSFAGSNHCDNSDDGRSFKYNGCEVSIHDVADCKGPVSSTVNLAAACTQISPGVHLRCIATADIPKIAGANAFLVYAGSTTCGGDKYAYFSAPGDICALENLKISQAATTVTNYVSGSECMGQTQDWSPTGPFAGESNPAVLVPGRCYGACEGDQCASIVVYKAGEIPSVLSPASVASTSALALALAYLL